MARMLGMFVGGPYQDKLVYSESLAHTNIGHSRVVVVKTAHALIRRFLFCFVCVLRNPNLHTSCPDPRPGTEVSSRR